MLWLAFPIYAVYSNMKINLPPPRIQPPLKSTFEGSFSCFPVGTGTQKSAVVDQLAGF